MPSGVIANKLLARLFGGVTPDLVLDPETLARVREHADPIRRRFYLLTAPCVLAFGCGLGLLAYRLRSSVEGPAVNPVLDEGRALSAGCFIVAGLWLALALGGVLERGFLPRLLGFERSLWVRCYATTVGWRPGRHAVFAVVLAVPMFVFMLLGGWVVGVRVDENGIAYLRGPWRGSESYANVSSVELYEGVDAPVGVLMRSNLVVRFGGGGEWWYDPDSKRSAPTPADVGEYIAERSGKSVVKGRIRP